MEVLGGKGANKVPETRGAPLHGLSVLNEDTICRNELEINNHYSHRRPSLRRCRL